MNQTISQVSPKSHGIILAWEEICNEFSVGSTAGIFSSGMEARKTQNRTMCQDEALLNQICFLVSASDIGNDTR